MNKSIKYILGLLLVVFTLQSCSTYGAIVKGDDYELKLAEAEKLYSEAKTKTKVKKNGKVKYKGTANYTRSLTLYEQVFQRYPRTDRGELSYYRMANVYYALGDYYMAGYYYNNFGNRFPFSDRAEECLFMTAMCTVKMSPEESLDQEDTDVAINDLQTFVDKFPESNLVDSCNKVMDVLRVKIQTKEYNAIALYDKMESYKAAASSANSFLVNYPQSKFGPEVSVIRMKNMYTLATKSIFSKQKKRYESVVENYAEFATKYLDTKYAKNAENWKVKSEKALVSVKEKQMFYDLQRSFDKTETKSNAKKMNYLKETLERYRNFVSAFPESEYLKKANDIAKKSEMEMSKL